MRTALTASAIAHALLWAPIVWPGAEPPAKPPEPILVEIVSPEEIGETSKAQGPAETDTPEASASQKSEPQASAPPQRQDPARERQQPPRPPAEPVRTASAAPAVPAASTPDHPQPWSSWFDTALSSPLVTANAGADVSASAANLSPEEIAAFKAHLQECWNPPAALTVADQNLLVVLRVSLKPNGALTAEPTLLAASASENGPALMQTAMRALRQCQPYGFLPAAKYKEWKVLDLSFSPTGLSALPAF